MGDDPSAAVRGPVAAPHKRSASRKTPNIGSPRVKTMEIVGPVNCGRGVTSM
jgi:hypothetical protein